jgi:Tfp pilus assembly protein PilX
VATVPVVLLLLLGLGILGLYANRGLVFEQRTAANQARSTQAFEVAEAGLEWAAS